MPGMTEPYSLSAYTALIAALAAGPRPLVEFDRAVTHGCLLRLDVDYDLDWAVATAEVNRGLGVSATYFVLMSAESYNPASTGGRTALARLAALDQGIGLHFHHQGHGPLDLTRLEREFTWLSALAPSTRPVVAWHNPEGDLERLNDAADRAGFINAYDPRWFGPECYRSDSNLRQSAEGLAAFAGTRDPALIQILLHPFNWLAGGATMDTILRRTLGRKVGVLADAFDGNRVWRESTGPAIRREMAAGIWDAGDAGE